MKRLSLLLLLGLSPAFGSADVYGSAADMDFYLSGRVFDGVGASALAAEFCDEAVHIERSNFPDKFTAKQVQSFFEGKPATKENTDEAVIQYSADADFEAAKPNMLQIFSGTSSAYAGRIEFTDRVTADPETHNLQGTYFLKPISTYQRIGFGAQAPQEFTVTLHKTTMPTMRDTGDLIGDPIAFYDMRHSVLGAQDPISQKGEGILKTLSFMSVGSLDGECVRQTRELKRLNGNMALWLLVLDQLDGRMQIEATQSKREFRGASLFTAYCKKNSYELSAEGILTMDQYVKINDELRAQIMAHFPFALKDIPDLVTIDYLDMMDNGLFIEAVIGKNDEVQGA